MEKNLYHISLSGSSDEAAYVVKELTEHEAELVHSIVDELTNEYEEVKMSRLPSLDDAVEEYIKYVDEKGIEEREKVYYNTAFGFASRKYAELSTSAVDWLAITICHKLESSGKRKNKKDDE